VEPGHEQVAADTAIGAAHLRPITIEIPTTWSPEQALAVYELLDDLREKIWDRYHYTLQDLLQQQLQSPRHR
jgi:hypothetical protein